MLPYQTRELRSIDLHIDVRPITVGLATPLRVELMVVGAGQALAVTDHIAELNPEALHQPER